MEQVKITFECSYETIPHKGFWHHCTATTSEGRSYSISIHYYNRTWEPYPFDSAKRSSVSHLIEDEVDEYVREYKHTHNNARLPRNFRKNLSLQIREKYADNPYCPSAWAYDHK